MEETITMHEQVRLALDGRTQRWLSMRIGVPESDLSKKMNGRGDWFTEAEISKINNALGVSIPYIQKPKVETG